MVLFVQCTCQIDSKNSYLFSKQIFLSKSKSYKRLSKNNFFFHTGQMADDFFCFQIFVSYKIVGWHNNHSFKVFFLSKSGSIEVIEVVCTNIK